MGESLGATILHGVGAKVAIYRQIERLALYHICTNFVPATLLFSKLLSRLSTNSSGTGNGVGASRRGLIFVVLGLILWWLLSDTLNPDRPIFGTLLAVAALLPWWAYASLQARGVPRGQPVLIAVGLACSLLLADWLALCGPGSCEVGTQLLPTWLYRAGSGVLVFIAVFGYWGGARSDEIDRDRVESRWLRARLDTLTAQLNPHFLFNTLNAISVDIETHPERARALVEKLSSLMRQTLVTEGDDFISLSEELALCAAYLEIQEVRFGDRLHFEIEPAGAPAAAQVPTLLLQPLIENAIKHGIAPSAKGGSVTVSASAEGKRLRLEVVNSLRRADSPAVSGGLGLSNTAQRLEALFPDGHELCYGSENGAWRVSIELPLILIERMAS